MKSYKDIAKKMMYLLDELNRLVELFNNQEKDLGIYATIIRSAYYDDGIEQGDTIRKNTEVRRGDFVCFISRINPYLKVIVDSNYLPNNDNETCVISIDSNFKRQLKNYVKVEEIERFVLFYLIIDGEEDKK